jgi:hypothetical protein
MKGVQLLKGSKKYLCPQCGRKRFVPFVDANGEIMTDDKGVMFGRCDREQECGFFYKPNGEKIIVQRLQERTEKEPIWFDNSVLTDKCSTWNNLIAYLGSLLPTEMFADALQRYHVQTLGNDGVVWWQVSVANVVRTGKVMRYNADGHRRHDGGTTWVHVMDSYKPYRHGEELRQCFFGEHLLNTDGRPVAVVESEKTAIVMASIETNYLWLACGGSQMLKDDRRLSVLQDRQVLLIPDEGQFYNWAATARKYNWECVELYGKGIDKGADIADIFINILENKDLSK